MIRSFRGVRPQIASTAYIAESAEIIGDVVIGEHSSVWPHAVLRGDDNYIRIGSYTNIQDHCVLHADHAISPLVVGDRVGVGHNAILHGCRIEPRCLIGMGAIILNEAQIGSGSVVAAGSVILERTVIPPGSLFAGVPGKLLRHLTEEDMKRVDRNIADYLRLKDQHLAERLERG